MGVKTNIFYQGWLPGFRPTDRCRSIAPTRRDIWHACGRHLGRGTSSHFPSLNAPPKPLVLLDAVFSSGSCRLRNRCAAAVFLVQGSCKVRGWHRVLFKAFGRSHRPGPDTFGVGPDLDPNQTLRAGSGPDSDSYRAGYMSDL